MKTYNVKFQYTADIDWDKIEKAEVNEYPWGGAERGFETYAQMVYAKTGDEKEGMYLHLVCYEANPVSVLVNHNEEVCTDSCMEAFFSMQKKGEPMVDYVNIECNSLGTTYLSLGKDRYDRQFTIDMGIPVFPIDLKISEDKWEYVAFVSLSAIQKMFGLDEVDETVEMNGNFYKCDENADAPPTMWNPIQWPHPDFHRPEQFGKLVFVK